MVERDTHMIFDELQYARLDSAVQLCALARCARVRRERVDEVREAVEHEYGAVPRRYRRGRLCRLRSVTPAHRVLLLRRSNAHLYGGIDERVERALDRRPVPAATAATGLPIVAVVIVDFCAVQREDGAQVLGVRQKRLRGRERGIGWVERHAQKSAALCCDGVEEDCVRRGGSPGVQFTFHFFLFELRHKTYS